jgi:hypothetical protein
MVMPINGLSFPALSKRFVHVLQMIQYFAALQIPQKQSHAPMAA